MKQFELIGHENLFNRDVFMMVLDQINVEVQEPPTMGQFACLCVLHGGSKLRIFFVCAGTAALRHFLPLTWDVNVRLGRPSFKRAQIQLVCFGA